MLGGAWAVNSKLGHENATVTSETPCLSIGKAIFSDSYGRNAHHASFFGDSYERNALVVGVAHFGNGLGPFERFRRE